MAQEHLHEDLRRRPEVRLGSERSFGLVFAGVSALVALWPLTRGDSPRAWALALGAAFLGAALLVPRILRPLNHGWLRLGLALGSVVAPVVLGAMFFGVVTPIGWLMRRFGRVPLTLGRDESVPSYWIPRVPPGPARESFRDQF